MAVNRTQNVRKRNTSSDQKSKVLPKRTSRAGVRKENRKVNKRSAAKRKKLITDELSVILLFALGIFILLASCGFMGNIGRAINSLLKGFLGQGGILFGIMLLALSLEEYLEKGSALKRSKLISVIGIFLVLVCFLGLLFGNNTDIILSPAMYYTLGVSDEGGGGVIGGLIVGVLSAVLGRVGAWLILVVALLICLVILTEKSIISFFGIGVKKSALAVKNRAQKTMESTLTARNERQRKSTKTPASIPYYSRPTFTKNSAYNREDESNNKVEPPIIEPVDINSGSYKTGTLVKQGEEGVLISSVSNETDPISSFMPESPYGEKDTVASRFDPETVDYDVDTVPFVETHSEKYKSYYSIANSDRPDKVIMVDSDKFRNVLNVDLGKNSGYAVGNGDDVIPIFSDDRFSSVSTDAFTDPNKKIVAKDRLNEALAQTEETETIGENLFTYGKNESTEDRIKSDISKHDVVDFDYPEDNTESVDNNANGLTELETIDNNSLSSDKYPENISADIKADIRENSSNVNRGNANSIQNVKHQLQNHKSFSEKQMPEKPYIFPPTGLLKRGQSGSIGSKGELNENAAKLEKTLRNFGVGVTVTNVVQGPRVSRYEMIPDIGVKVSRITALQGDIKLALASTELRIEAPIPGKSAVGIEIPNLKSQLVRFRDILETDEFKNSRSPLSWGLGLDIQGKPVVTDISRMPHVLVAGTTGSGKSVGINSLIMSVLYRSTPDEVKMILIDPKVVELSVYNGIPHLLTDVVTKPERAITALNWAVAEMNKRYKMFEQSGTRNISGYNEKIERTAQSVSQDAQEEEKQKKLPLILIIIDELSELMMHSKKDVEGAIVSLSQLARAAGIHLVVATQRPSVDVITGLIKSNIPSRIAYRLPSAVDSRTILDCSGAETLLGNGDMLYKPGDKNAALRIQGAFLSDEEVEGVVKFLRKNNSQNEGSYALDEAINASMEIDPLGTFSANSGKPERDDYFADAARLIINNKKASIGVLQRKFKIGFNRAARIMDQLHEAGVVSDSDGTKERQILMSLDQFEKLL